tara:strand:- start:245 stop:493 length:249 start_codon:yes stop_codon:yes gene_type:complete
MKFSIVLFLFFSILNAQRVVGYYPYWVQDAFPPQDLDLETFTHINHSFAWPDEEGGIESPAGFLMLQLQIIFIIIIESLFLP